VSIKLSELGNASAARRLSNLAASPEPAEDPEVVEAPEEEEEEAAAEEIAAKPLQAKTAKDLWLEELAEAKISENSVMTVLDSLLSKGHYEESYQLRGTVFTFRTRTTRDADRLADILYDTEPRTTNHFNHIVTRHNVAASLARYGNEKFIFPSPENAEDVESAWRARYNFCTNLPEQVFFTLGQVLVRFDRKVQLAGDPRAIENF